MAEIVEFMERIKESTVRCSIRLDYIISPINVYEMFDVLKKEGYEITAPSLPPKPSIPINISFSGPFAKKNGNIYDANTDRAFFGVAGETFESSYHGLTNFMHVINEYLGVNFNQITIFHEIIAGFSCSSTKIPIQSISSTLDDCQIIPKLNAILTDSVSLYTLKVVRKGAVPNQKNWFEITIQPDNINTTRYNISVIYRSEKVSEFEEFGKNMLRYLANIIQEIEK